MRKFIIDTDTGSDDAVALMMAVLSPEVEVLGVTTVCGNVPLDKATQNALMTLEVCSREDIEVYPGLDRPMLRDPVTAVNVHGEDGMGDLDLIHPKKAPASAHAVDYILEQARRYPGELELVMLGPATNVAAAILRDRAAMAGIRHIWSMGTGGFGPGNTTPVAEFNVYEDAESYRVLVESGIPLTVIGFDLCVGPAAWNQGDMERIAASGPVGRFAVDCNRSLLAYNIRRGEAPMVDLPDAVAMAVALWPEVTLKSRECGCHCCTNNDRCYGQVIFYDPTQELAAYTDDIPEDKAEVILQIDEALYKSRLEALLSGK